MTTSKRRYNKTGLYTGGSKVQTETHRYLANGLYFATREQAQKIKDIKNFRQRVGYISVDPKDHPLIEEAMADGNSQSMKRMLEDSKKLAAIKQLIEDGTSTSDFIIKVIDIIEGESNVR